MTAAKKEEVKKVANASDGGQSSNEEKQPEVGAQGSPEVGVVDGPADPVGAPEDRGPAAPGAKSGGPEIALQTYVVKFGDDVEIEVEASTPSRAENAARGILAGRAEVATKSVDVKGSKK